MRDIKDIRLDINKVDSELKKLFLQRMEYVEQVREYKEATNTPVKNKGREADILKSKLEGVENFRGETAEFFKSMIEISCNYQDERLSNQHLSDIFVEIDNDEYFNKISKVCYQGIKGSYSHEIATKYFANKEILSVNTFREVVDSVLSEECDIGILPIENLSMGCVSDVYDLMLENDVYITHCSGLEIKHCLAGLGNIEDIKNVISHPQALGQCSSYIENYNFLKHECTNTAVAAKMVAQGNDKSTAAICSETSAELYGLNILDNNISNIGDNVTKFIFISKKPLKVADADMVSIIFTIKHEAGSLARVLNDFAKNDINMTKIESRPSKDSEWEYVFYVDLVVPDFDIVKYFSRIRYMFEDFKISGIYNTLG